MLRVVKTVAMDPATSVAVRDLLANGETLRERLDRVPSLAARRSRAAEDLKTSPKTGRLVGVYARQAIAATLDHLGAWKLLIDPGPLGLYSPWMLARAIIEGAGRALWHVEPDDSHDRVARAYAGRRKDQEERRRFEAAEGPGPRFELPPGGKSPEKRIVEIDMARRSECIDRVEYEDTTSVVRRHGWERSYRLASSFAHGLEWSMVAADLHPDPSIPTNPGTGVGIVMINDARLLEIAETSVSAIESAILAVDEYAALRR
jgi:hypothetical protein